MLYRIFLIITISTLLSACGHNLPPMTSDPSGNYLIRGTNPNGSSYEGNLSVLAGSPYRFRWETGGEAVIGVGVGRDEIVAAAYGGEGCGVALYLLRDDGVLDGIWAIDMSGIGSEIATPPAPDPELGGQYSLQGRNPNGSTYDGFLDVRLNQDRFEFTWSFQSSEQRGVGLQRGPYIAVGFGQANCGVALYQIGADGHLDGEWVLPEPAEAQIAIEQATRR